jgi:Tetratricopeptide repeat.
VSLLMDALRRAEEAKRKASANARPTATVAGELRLDPLPLETPAPSDEQTFSSLADDLDAVEADLASRRPSAAATGRAPTAARSAAAFDSQQADERTAARNLFAVKQTPRSRTSLWLFLGLLGVATIAIGGYFWWQLQSISGAALVAPTSAARPPAYPPTPAMQQQATPLAHSPASTLQTAAEGHGEQPPAATPAGEAPERSTPAQRKPDASSSSSTGRAPRDGGMAPRAAAAEVFQRSSGRKQATQTLEKAYDAWLADRLDDARRGYEQVLRGDPRNADALLGLAAIANRQGQLERAQGLFLQVLESDPGNMTAQAALINMRGQSGASQSESRLKTLIARQPDSSALFFALGNLYAGQSRWSDAQQAYFQAYSLEPGNADHLFNVAVSLDHLRQKKLAAQYYQMALSAAETSPSAFDKNAAEQRILELQR